MEEAGFNVTHVYGLPEVYGPAVVCQWQESWADKDKTTQPQTQRKTRCALSHAGRFDGGKPGNAGAVPDDGETGGGTDERQHRDERLPQEPGKVLRGICRRLVSFGRPGVLHSDGYIELKDRSKDIIISGGENISSVEIENVLYQHPDILEAGVVACPDDKWGETLVLLYAEIWHLNPGKRSDKVLPFQAGWI
ncbi:MAG: hypothetical protein Ct9H300mP28_28070 [Pseudomonadota bacterium]|nr:MAG: hypothetical protein Ct9H300mP28_28070 [Pseudomonadota bacterium]